MSENTISATQEQLHDWYVESREHNVAHAKAATHAHRLQRWSSVLAALLAVFSGSAWTADLAKVGLFSSTTVQWVAAIAAFLSATVVAIVTAANWKQEEIDHTADKLLWMKVDSGIEELKLSSNGGLDGNALKQLKTDRREALTKEHDLTADELYRARLWLAENRPEVLAG